MEVITVRLMLDIVFRLIHDITDLIITGIIGDKTRLDYLLVKNLFKTTTD